ncbi:unnamed protein product, partial [Bubo scandiacus]
KLDAAKQQLSLIHYVDDHPKRSTRRIYSVSMNAPFAGTSTSTIGFLFGTSST